MYSVVCVFVYIIHIHIYILTFAQTAPDNLEEKQLMTSKYQVMNGLQLY